MPRTLSRVSRPVSKVPKISPLDPSLDRRAENLAHDIAERILIAEKVKERDGRLAPLPPEFWVMLEKDLTRQAFEEQCKRLSRLGPPY